MSARWKVRGFPPNSVGASAPSVPAEAPDITEAEVQEALGHLNQMWNEMFPAGNCPGGVPLKAKKARVFFF